MIKPKNTRVALWRERVFRRYILLTSPGASGLPNWRVVTWFPALAGLGVMILVILHISGTSSGVYWYTLGTGHDPHLLLGSPKPIRSDEWLVQQSWVVSQSNTGFGATNPTFPGGSDMTLLNELPSWHWSSAFRPHLWGYLLFGLNAGVAWHWWVPALALVSGCYLFMVTILPRRPLTAAFFAVATYFTPLLQWFYTPSSVWPVAWALLALAAVTWIIVDPRKWVRVTWSAVLGYTSITMAMGLYVPFMLPGIFVVLAFTVGMALLKSPWRQIGVRPFLVRIAPLGVAAVGAATVTACWVASRWATFGAIQSTVYPGSRTEPTGALLKGDPFLTGIAGAPWEEALRYTGASVLGGNSSEGSSVILLSVFLLPGLVWFVARSLRRRERLDRLVLASLAVMALFAAFLFIPGWDGLAHVLQLDRIDQSLAHRLCGPLAALRRAHHRPRRHPSKGTTLDPRRRKRSVHRRHPWGRLQPDSHSRAWTHLPGSHRVCHCAPTHCRHLLAFQPEICGTRRRICHGCIDAHYCGREPVVPRHFRP